MKSVFFVFFIFIVSNIILTDATTILYSSVGNSDLPYPYRIPYALGFSYEQLPYVLPYSQSIYLKHHHPDHKGDENDREEWDKLHGSGQMPTMMTIVTQGQDDKKQDADKVKDESEKMKLEDISTSNDSSKPQKEIGSLFNGSGGGSSSSSSISAEEMPRTIEQLKYYTFSYPITYTIPTPLYLRTSSQFHHQDNLGHYYYGYTSPESSKQELKAEDEITRGAYSYIDADGKLQTVYYLSDSDGFRVVATNLPQAPQPVEIPDSPEIALAKKEHFEAQKEALNRLAEANKKLINNSDNN